MSARWSTAELNAHQMKATPALPLMIGIDPDTEKSGVAMLHSVTKRMDLLTLDYEDLREFLLPLRGLIACVVIEAGWLNEKANTHDNTGNARVAARIGAAVGANAQIGKEIEKFCIRFAVPHRLQAPLYKRWGKDSRQKISHPELLEYVKSKGVDWYDCQTSNQEKRDAALLILTQ